MSADLYPTPTRLALLRDIADPDVKVFRYREFQTGNLASIADHGGGGERMVTARAAEMQRAGWIRVSATASGPSWYARRNWEITDLGRQVLAAADKEK